MLQLAEHERSALADWMQRRSELAAARYRNAEPELWEGPYEYSGKEGGRQLQPLLQSLERDERSGLPAGTDAVHRETHDSARTLLDALAYDVRATKATHRLAAHRHRADRDGVPWFAGERGAALQAEIGRLADEARSATFAPLVALPFPLARARWEQRRKHRRHLAARRLVERVSTTLTVRRAGLDAAQRSGTWFQGRGRKYPSWRAEADKVVPLAVKMLGDEARYRTYVDADPDDPWSKPAAGARPGAGTAVTDTGWDAFRAAVAELQDGLRRDDVARKLEETRKTPFGTFSRLGRRPAYYRTGYADFIRELQQLEPTTLPGEVPPDFAAVLNEHRTQAALHGTVTDFVTSDLPKLEAWPDDRRNLSRADSEFQMGDLDLQAHTAWTTGAERLVATARPLLDDAWYTPHLREVQGAAERIQRALAPVRQQLDVDREAKAVLHDWRVLVERARQRRPAGTDQRPAAAQDRRDEDAPFFEKGYDALIERVRAVDEQTEKLGRRVPEFAEALAKHPPWPRRGSMSTGSSNASAPARRSDEHCSSGRPATRPRSRPPLPGTTTGGRLSGSRPSGRPANWPRKLARTTSTFATIRSAGRSSGTPGSRPTPPSALEHCRPDTCCNCTTLARRTRPEIRTPGRLASWAPS